MDAVNNPEDATAGTRKVPFSRVLYIEQDDFREDPPKQYFRLSPGREVRLRYGYFITCTNVVKDETGKVVEVHCTYDPATRGGNAPGRPQGEVDDSLGLGRARGGRRGAAVRKPVHEGESERCRRGPGLHGEPEPELARGGARLQAGAIAGGARDGQPLSVRAPGLLLRGPGSSTEANPVFNRTVALRDTWAKIEKRNSEMIILGIGGILGDAASALLKDGELVAAVEETKVDAAAGSPAACPRLGIATCLELAGVTPAQVDCVALVRPISFGPASALHLQAAGACSRTAGSRWWSTTRRMRRRPTTLRRSTKPRC